MFEHRFGEATSQYIYVEQKAIFTTLEEYSLFIYIFNQSLFVQARIGIRNLPQKVSKMGILSVFVNHKQDTHPNPLISKIL